MYSNNATERLFQGRSDLGLQAAIQAYVLVPSESDDRFRFAHNRYVQASAQLKECNARGMHYIIAQTLLKYYAAESRQRDSTAAHICEAAYIIKAREPCRQPFRELLMDCARMSTENGARSTAAKYYNTAVQLLQDNPWTDDGQDASYDETMQLYLRSAECYLFMGQYTPARDILQVIFDNAKSPLDKAPAYVLQSRIFAQNGDSKTALTSLKECLKMLGVELDDNPTFEKCDQKFEQLSRQIQSMDRATLVRPAAGNDSTLASIGAVLGRQWEPLGGATASGFTT